ncbi:uncharacterized protein LOC127732250 [Mytilus californianus]|uniref:uncharacterized protein LOC127732250 n=1 Tax=Mytilus californianus TaxID=6549 RepID=UPI002247FBCD|nr:uncharacterized protein LOC127732250 [Mytilus californianus]
MKQPFLEIQGHKSVGGRMLHCKTFYGYKITDLKRQYIEGDCGMCIVEFGDGFAQKKIEVICWESLRFGDKRKLHKPLTCLIFANREVDDRLKLMEEVISFARQTKLPCHFVGTRVLLICDSTDIAFIHYETDKVIIIVR